MSTVRELGPDDRLISLDKKRGWLLDDKDKYTEVVELGGKEGEDFKIVDKAVLNSYLYSLPERSKTTLGNSDISVEGKTILFITGKTAGGKSTLENDLCKIEGYNAIISTTTRAPRSGEIDGKSYFFVDKQEFYRRKRVETNPVKDYLYGLELRELIEKLKASDVVTFVVEAHGYIETKAVLDKHLPGLKQQTAFMNPPDSEIIANMNKLGVPQKEIDERMNRPDFAKSFQDKVIDKGLVSLDNGDFIEINHLYEGVSEEVFNALCLPLPISKQEIESLLDQGGVESSSSVARP